MVLTQTQNAARRRTSMAACVGLPALWVAAMGSAFATTTTERLGLPPLVRLQRTLQPAKTPTSVPEGG